MRRRNLSMVVVLALLAGFLVATLNTPNAVAQSVEGCGNFDDSAPLEASPSSFITMRRGCRIQKGVWQSAATPPWDLLLPE